MCCVREDLSETEEVLDRFVRDDALRLRERVAEVDERHTLEIERETERGDDLAERSGMAERTEHQEVGAQSEPTAISSASTSEAAIGQCRCRTA